MLPPPLVLASLFPLLLLQVKVEHRNPQWFFVQVYLFSLDPKDNPRTTEQTQLEHLLSACHVCLILIELECP